MSFNGIMGSALSGLHAAQLGMRTVSNNMANVNTPGYVRTEVTQVPRVSGGAGVGVEVTGVKRVSDVFLTAASLRAKADSGASAAISNYLDRLQSQFGATTSEGGLYARLLESFSSISSALNDPTEASARISIASDLQAFFDEGARLSAEVRQMRAEADQRIGTHVQRINEILGEIEDLNAQTQRLSASSADTSGAENRQDQLMNELAGLMDVRGERQTDGRLVVATTNGVVLAGQGRLDVSYIPAGTGAHGAEFGRITAVVPATGKEIDLSRYVTSGELKGLMDVRDKELPAIAAQLSEFMSQVADALNAEHNDATAVPPPNVLTGRNTGLVGGDALTGEGRSTMAIVDGSGQLVNSLDIEFNAGGFTVNGNAGTTINDLVALINAESGGAATASFSEGRLVIEAADPSHGIANLNDEDDPSSIGGRGFAHFFGLNDIVSSSRPGFFETGLTAGTPLGTQAGATMSFKLTGPDGRVMTEVEIPADQASLGDFVNALNDPASGLGQYGSYALDDQGRLAFTPNSTYRGYDLKLTDDTSWRGDTGIQLSQLFGIGEGARNGRAEHFEVSERLVSSPQSIAFSKLDLNGAAPGDLVLTAGDARGGQALYDALTKPRSIPAAGGFGGGTASLESYGARLMGDVGARAARAERGHQAAEAVRDAADQKRADLEGVNMDEELARMTLYQTAYNASARLVQAAKEMSDVLINMGR
ncbi:flagellar hook-associated protein FlgK [Glycocaulis profundi]|nr:flagellar hook-associated protein FlgK [Glycocaulis profundi]